MKKGKTFSILDYLKRVVTTVASAIQLHFSKVKTVFTHGQVLSIFASAKGQLNKLKQYVNSEVTTWFTYFLIDKKNGKMYVGCTHRPLERWRVYNYQHGEIGVALKGCKNVTDRFYIIVDRVFTSLTDAARREEDRIAYFNTCNPAYGYNVVNKSPELSAFKKAKAVGLSNVTIIDGRYAFVATLTNKSGVTWRVRFKSMTEAARLTNIDYKLIQKEVRKAKKNPIIKASKWSESVEVPMEDFIKA